MQYIEGEGKGKVGERPASIHRLLINEEKWEIHLTSYRAEILSSFFRSVFKKKNDKKEFG